MAENEYDEVLPTEGDDATPEYSGASEPEEDDGIVEKYDLGCYGPWLASPHKTYLKEDLDSQQLILLKQ